MLEHISDIAHGSTSMGGTCRGHPRLAITATMMIETIASGITMSRAKSEEDWTQCLDDGLNKFTLEIPILEGAAKNGEA